jgi:hypothetical protein
MYVFVVRDKETGSPRAIASRFLLADADNADVMFRVSTPDSITAARLIADLNLEMMIFGEPDMNRVDRSIYADVLMGKARLADELATARETIDLQAGHIRQKNVIISNLEAEIVDNRNRVSSMKTMLENIMNAIALDTALERTRQQRNAAMRFIVRWIRRVLDSDPLDMDDIPF